MISVDYTYYKNSYLGDVLTEAEFPKFVKRSEPYISARTFGQADVLDESSPYADKLKDCICSVAEVLKSNTSDDGAEHGLIASENVGGSWSRTYQAGSSDEEKTVSGMINSKIYLMLANTGLLYGGVC